MDPHGWLIEGGGSKDGYFRRNIFLTEDRIGWLRNQFNNTDVYTTVLYYDSNHQSEALKYGAFYIDLDSKDNLDMVLNDAMRIASYMDIIYGIPKDRLHLYYSGYKGIHIMVPPEVLGITPTVHLNGIYRMAAEELVALTTQDPNNKDKKTLDIAMYDCRRLFRLPNSINAKSGLYKIPLTYQELSTWSPEQIREAAQNPRTLTMPFPILSNKAKMIFSNFATRWNARLSTKRPAGPISGRLKDVATPPCIQHLLDNQVPEGRRNNTAIALASFYNQQGLAQKDAIEIMLSWGNIRCSPPMSEREIEMVVNSAYKNNYTFGCSTISQLSECNKAQCQLRKKEDGNNGRGGFIQQQHH